MVKHPQSRAERRRSAEAKALQSFKPKRINGKKRKIFTEIQEQETDNEIRQHIDGIGETAS